MLQLCSGPCDAKGWLCTFGTAFAHFTDFPGPAYITQVGILDCTASPVWCAQEHDELEEVAAGQQPQKEKEKAGLLSKALRAPLGTRTLSLHNLLDQAPVIEGQQVRHIVDLLDSCNC